MWLVNTGWTGGPYGAGHRMSLGYTRAMVRSALAGRLETWRPSPTRCSGCTSRRACPTCLTTSSTRAAPGRTRGAYDAQAAKLAGMFRENFKKFADEVPDGVKAAGPL